MELSSLNAADKKHLLIEVLHPHVHDVNDAEFHWGHSCTIFAAVHLRK